MKTIFLDLDGCVFEPPNSDSMVQVADAMHNNTAKLLPGVRERFDIWFNKHYKIIITTGRPESHRQLTAYQLVSNGLFYNQLIMDCGHCPRVLINDKKSDGQTCATAIELDKNKGLEDIDI